jgi:hypothetical protein
MKIQIEGLGIVKDLICFCFEYSVDAINQDYLENGKSTIMEKNPNGKEVWKLPVCDEEPKGKMMLRRCPPGGG